MAQAHRFLKDVSGILQAHKNQFRTWTDDPDVPSCFEAVEFWQADI
jgi:hypothetical protein